MLISAFVFYLRSEAEPANEYYVRVVKFDLCENPLELESSVVRPIIDKHSLLCPAAGQGFENTRCPPVVLFCILLNVNN